MVLTPKTMCDSILHHLVSTPLKHYKSDLGHLMMIPSKDQILKRLDTCFQTKPDHMRHSLSQFLLDLIGPKVTTPVIIPGERGRNTADALNLTKTSWSLAAYYLHITENMIRWNCKSRACSCYITTSASVRSLRPLFWAARVSESCRNSGRRDRSRQAAGPSDCTGPVSETAGRDPPIHLDEDSHLEVHLEVKVSLGQIIRMTVT